MYAFFVLTVHSTAQPCRFRYRIYPWWHEVRCYVISLVAQSFVFLDPDIFLATLFQILGSKILFSALESAFHRNKKFQTSFSSLYSALVDTWHNILSNRVLLLIWYVFVLASLHMRREENPTRCHRMLYCIYDTLNMFRALLCPSSGALDNMYAIAVYGVQCLVAGCRGSGAGEQGVRPGRGMLHVVQHPSSWTHTLLPCTWPRQPATKHCTP